MPRICRPRILILAGLGLVLATTIGYGSDVAEAQFDEGIQLYESQRYVEALTAWRGVLAEGYASADLFLNLGNAAYRAGELGWSIYYYEQAQRWSPRDPDVLSNLGLVRREALGADLPSVRSGLLDQIDSIQNRWSLRGAVDAAAAALWVAVGLLLISWTRGFPWRWTRILQGGAVAVLLLAGLLVGLKVVQHSVMPKAIAIEAVAARSEPAADATVEFRLPAGSPVGLDRSSPGWREIVISRSLRGWVEERDLALFSEPVSSRREE